MSSFADARAFRQAPPKEPPAPWKTLYFDNDFGYKNGPYHDPLFGEEAKEVDLDGLDRLPFFENSTISFGGELRHRYMGEDDRLRPGGPGSSTYQLWRWRN